MSIETLIAAAERANPPNLVRFVPRSRHPPKRRAFLTAQAMTDLFDPNSAPNLLGGAGYSLAALTRWTLGERIYPEYIKRLDPPPPEIWEIRVTAPRPQWRLFCLFPAMDTLIVTRCHSRSLLGRKGSAEWKRAMTDTAAQWSSLFGTAPPYANGDRSINYIAENRDDFEV